MSEKKSIYVNGVRFFKPNENAPENLVANVLNNTKVIRRIFTSRRSEKCKR